jgi:hypothetical protein
MAWPLQPPMLLTTEQSEDLGTYIVCDSLPLEDVSFEQLVNERRQRLDFHPKVKTLRHNTTEPPQRERHKRDLLYSTLDQPTTDQDHAVRPPQISRQVGPFSLRSFLTL